MRLDSIDERLGTLEKEIKRNRCATDTCKERCDRERGKVWEVLDDVRLRQAAANGARQEVVSEHGRAHNSGVLHWAKVGAIFTSLYVLLQLAQVIILGWK